MHWRKKIAPSSTPIADGQTGPQRYRWLCRQALWFSGLAGLGWLASAALTAPATAQQYFAQRDRPQNRSRIELADDTAQVQGTTAGAFSLTQLASRDRNRRLCLGYGTRQPTHTLVLTEARPRLRVALNSRGGDTTLLVQGPGGIQCNDNRSRDSRDAAITGNNWPAGTYNIWVGTYERGDRLNYELRVFEPDGGGR